MQGIRFIHSCLLACLAALLLQGCGIPFNREDAAKTPEAAYLQATMNRLAAHDFAAVEAAIDSRLKQSDIDHALHVMAAQLPPQPPLQKLPVAWSFFKKSNWNGDATERSASVAYEYGYAGNRWLIASAQLTGEPGNFRLLGLHVDPLPASLEQTNAFSLKGKDIGHYAFFAAGTLSLLVTLFAFIACLRMKGLKRKWLWAIGTLVTVCAFSLNWTTGEFRVVIPTINLLGWMGVRQGWVGPWFLVFPLPIGAIIFLGRHWRINAPPKEDAAP